MTDDPGARHGCHQRHGEQGGGCDEVFGIQGAKSEIGDQLYGIDQREEAHARACVGLGVELERQGIDLERWATCMGDEARITG